ncbi:uncharacterized protein LOC109820589 isoform X1 [Asparagus officinalis]|uniref:uncharacterized protein LOC109820589 isoform X1 n=1 Tax=Asparagus officinalis TaxID=4686 RepID=UPI00098E7F10|nr:uncharacterized protein LOC109820589 isoform X1 [Asparagus officinalis]XP_020242336.1 uncharacterized protein LOC109820589 isoform X1 [Asparagus officinalis]
MNPNSSENCIGAIDGSHFRVKVAKEDTRRYRGRKEFPTQNVLAACTFDLKFTYVLAGWEGSASDSRVLNNALIRQDKIFVPQGKYYLVDGGFMLRPGFLTPFRSTRYHLKEYSTRQPENPREVYNHHHSSLRNAIERAFGVLKKRFPILGNGTEPHYPIKTQKDIIYACTILHNFLMGVDPDEGLLEQVDQEVLNQMIDVEAHVNDNEEYRRGEILRQKIADDMWRDYSKYFHSSNKK